MRKIWHNGEIKPESEAKLSIYDSGSMYGDGIFEMQRTYNKRTFKLHEHIERLYVSAKYVGIDIPYLPYELYEAHENLLIENRYEFDEDDEIRSLINVTKGALSIYERIVPRGTQVMITCFPLKWVIPTAYNIYMEGVDVIVPAQRTIPAQLLEPKVKMRSRLHFKLAELEVAKYNPSAWALLFDPSGFVAEGTGSNFFYVKSGKLFTPEPRNCLRGISQKYVMRLARQAGIKVIVKNIELYDIINADEAFFTNTPYGIVPIRSINGHAIKCVGRITRQLMAAWSKDVSCDFIGQTKEWGNES